MTKHSTPAASLFATTYLLAMAGLLRRWLGRPAWRWLSASARPASHGDRP